MSLFKAVLTKTAKNDTKKLDKQIAKRIQKKLSYFVDSDDPIGFAEKLAKPADAQYRWRVGDYRVLFDLDGKTIIILKIQHRKEVYKR